MLRALLRMLRCVSVAPFGLPVVPLVYWMLMGSSHWSDDSRSRRASITVPARGDEVVPEQVPARRRPELRRW